jgi:myo-inositol 2-dehydrogenase / D-chiro-inositol 1-dehydrogenase
MSIRRTSQKIEQAVSSRRQFLGGALTAAASTQFLAATAGLAVGQEQKPAAPQRKIKMGWVGCGGRGTFLANFFRDHGGYELHAVADYFQPVADRWGDTFGVDKARRFSGLSGYKKVIESGIEAIVLEVPTCFFADQATAAAEAGLHVYMAKPVAVDVPGCLRIEAAGKLATQKQRVFFVDYQIPTDPVNISVAERIRKGEMGKIVKVSTVGAGGGRDDPPKTATIESRLQGLIWDYDIAIGGSFLVSFDIHAIDAALWILGQRPVAAMGDVRVCRPNPHGDSPDAGSIIYQYADGVIHEHSNQALPNATDGELSCKLYSCTGHAVVPYWRKAHFHLRGQSPMTAEVVDLYAAGAKRNVASFHQDVIAGKTDNPTVRRAVDGCLTCILGREAGLRHGRLTMEELLKENKRIEVDLTGLKA